MPNGGKYGIKKRPYVEKVLDHLSEMWEMVIFTAAEKTYADLILDQLDPERKYFRHRFYRENCIQIEEGVYVKDLRIFKDREVEDIVIVDNSILSFAFQLDNGVPICAFLAQNLTDQELLYLITYLDELVYHKDCRGPNKKTFKLSELMESVQHKS